MKKNTTPVVDQIGKINFKGNIIPVNWLKNITFENGKPDLIGVYILSEIVYWYRPQEIRDEVTGQLLTYKKKFKADKLQRNYGSFSAQMGVSKRQVQAAMHRLCDRGIITIEFRDIISESGTALSNVMFLEPIPSEIYRITYDDTGGWYNQMYDPIQSNAVPDTLKCMTYTKNTPENNLEEEERKKEEDDSFSLIQNLDDLGAYIGFNMNIPAREELYKKWTKDWCFGHSEIKRAAQKMINMAQVPNLEYIDSVLYTWLIGTKQKSVTN